MNLTPDYISNVIEDQFPEYFREQNSDIVALVMAYFEYLEQENKTTKLTRTLKSNRDIDTTVQDFIIHFKNTFLHGTQEQSVADERFLIKHISDLYQSKGTSRSYELLIKMLFGEEVEIFLPSTRILTPSQSTFFKPIYLELSPSERTRNFITKQVTGSSSGATGFCESVVVKTVNGKRISVAYLSSVNGKFETNEYITDDGLIKDAPKMVGSLTSITIQNGGRNFNVGDIFQIESSAGKGGKGKAKITTTQDATGRVNFVLANGGYGYTVSNTYTRSLSSNATLIIENIVNANNEIDDYFLFENVEQPLANVSWASGNSDFKTYANNTVIIGANTSGSQVANGYMVQDSGNLVTIMVHDGNFGSADFLYVSNTSTNVQIDTVVNATAVGEYIGTQIRGEDSNTIVIGLNANNKAFYKGDGSFVRGTVSGTTANVANVGSGVAADYEIGGLAEQETLTLFTDIIGANNQALDPRPFSNVHVNGSNAGIGFVDSITLNTGVSYDNLANAGSPFATNGSFSAGDYVFEANLVVNAVVVTATGSGYSNSDTVTFTGGGPSTSAIGNVVTDGTGKVQAIELSNKGIQYEAVPAVTITSSGSGVSLTARMQASGNSIGAVGTIESVNSTVMIVRNMSNGSFTNTRTVTNEGVNAFANIVSSAILGGASYQNSDTVTISGGTPNTGATATLQTNTTGGINAIAVVEPGTEYNSNASIVINTSTGTNATLAVNMDFGYGFPKSGSADLTTILYNALTFANFSIGTIASFKGVNPGTGYNLDPIALVHNPYVAGFNRRDLICVIDNRDGLFAPGERLNQTLSLPGFLVNHSNSSSNGITLNANNQAIAVGEGVIQLTTGATGVIETSNSTFIKISNVNGAFNDATVIQTQTTTANVTPLSSGVSQTTTAAIATGTFKSRQVNNGVEQIKIRRLSFGQSFVPGSSIIGLSSGASANVQWAYQDEDTLPIGLNANVQADVITANGVAQTLEVIDSGFGYEQDDIVNLVAANSNFIVTGKANITNQGIGQGQWRDRQSFVSDVNKIQDSDYYQEYSYVSRTGIALAKYEEQLKEILHLAGTKLFGEVVRTTYSNKTTTSNGVVITTSS
jgi:hypothetical protein|tara:strand:- start:3938 stop:7228 length:3291 start_codon:yes stop_codon:yes gene_type:complete